MLTGPDLLFIPQNPPTTARHGGTHRTAQVLELLQSSGANTEVVGDLQAEPSRLRRFVRGSRIARREFGDLPISLAKCRHHARLGLYARSYEELLNAFPSIRAFVVESFETHRLIALATDGRHLPVIFVPQNIEVIPGRFVESTATPSGLTSFRIGIEMLRRAAAVFTISFEEMWFLRGLGVNAEWLPYHPADAELPPLCKIRARRSPTRDADYLVLGTAIHPPTREGMLELIEWLKQYRGDARFVLAGYQTQTLGIDFSARSNIRFPGEVSEDSLAELLASCRALIAHQPRGGGALTRIPLAVCAGVPVLANQIAARSHFVYPGVHIYKDREGLFRLLEQPHATPPLPERPTDAEAAFVGTIRKIVNNV